MLGVLKCLQLSIATCATASASYLVTRILAQLVEDEGKGSLLASKDVLEGAYCDDILTRPNSMTEPGHFIKFFVVGNDSEGN